ncbi:MAG: UDP-glucuronic acid decarboxylase family protein [Alphaproteobacteria bacterium]
MAQGRILVTGGAGFIGSHLCERLLAQGARVTCLDDYSTGTRQNVSHLEGRAGFESREHDVTLPFEAEVDEIYNLACPASPVAYQRDPIGTTRTSVLGALNALDLARRRAARILQASTSEVYGDPEVHPQAEDYRGNVNPIGPRACYNEGKRCAETLFFDYRRQHGVAIRVARIFNTYGPRMRADDGRVVSSFIVQALTGEPLTIFGDGNQTRSFCYVDDLIEGIVRLMAASDDPAAPVNLGHPGEVTIKALAERVIEITGSRSRIVSRPLPGDDPARRRPDISRAEARLGWAPTVGLDEGLGRTIAYFYSVRAGARGRRRETPPAAD